MEVGREREGGREGREEWEGITGGMVEEGQ